MKAYLVCSLSKRQIYEDSVLQDGSKKLSVVESAVGDVTILQKSLN